MNTTGQTFSLHTPRLSLFKPFF